IDAGALRDRFGDLAETVRHSLSEAGERASDLGGDARHRGEQILHDAQHSSRKALKKHGKTAQRYAHDAGAYAKDHAKEGGTLLALATIAAAIGAAALDVRRPDSRIRSLGKF
ncbi:MAG: short-chain dehydrogenase, partial [Brevundimonas sp.]|nr:short-chain dehydrogenase [Brevundimonas sp.]